ncbi:MAG: alpha/beta hydrolase [Hyphomicrobiaceae bacterium]
MSNRPTDPEVLAFIDETARHYPETSNRASADEARAAYNALCKAFDYPHPAGVSTKDSTVEAANPDREIPARHYTSGKLIGTCLMYLHGGGWIVGGLESHDSICAEICANTGMDVIAVDYRLCPEHRHPAALDDCEAAFTEVAGRYDTIIVGGDSAGGHLTAALCIRLRDAAGRQPAGQLLIYPAVGILPEGGSYESNADAPGLTTDDVIHYWGILAGDADWRTTTDAGLAPIRAADFSDLPPAIISSAGIDPIRDDAMHYASRLTEAGVPVQWRNDPQLIHGHLRARHMSKVAAAHFRWICDALTRLAEN